jgi:F-type H+-transporting ATPase subunit a
MHVPSVFRNKSSSVLFAFFALLLQLPSPAHAAEGGLVNIINWYYVLAGAVFGGEEGAQYWGPAVAAAAVLVLIVVFGNIVGLHRLRPEELSDEDLLPPGRFGFRGLFEMFWSVISSTLGSVLGKDWERYAPLLGGTFFFIILSNLSGLVPGFAPATEYINTTLGMGIVIFLAFNYVGLSHGGLAYVKHMCGPVLVLAPLIFVIEFIGLLARPLSLGLRLYGNINGDHMVFRVFSTIMESAGTPFIPVPAGILLFGTLVSVLQAFIFMTLSAVYVRLSLDAAHHH